MTLACEGKFYKVHKLVLSTCSEYFEQMFEETQCKHPVIVLKDIKSEELESLLSYMYIGEVNVVQDKLSGLIKAAECLRIKGLAVPDEEPSNNNNNASNKSKRTNESNNVGSEPKRRKPDEPSSRQQQHQQHTNGAEKRRTSEANKPKSSNSTSNNMNVNSSSNSCSRDSHSPGLSPSPVKMEQSSSAANDPSPEVVSTQDFL